MSTTTAARAGAETDTGASDVAAQSVDNHAAAAPVAAAPSTSSSSLSLRERPAVRKPLLERGAPEPPGRAKRRKAPAKKKATAPTTASTPAGAAGSPGSATPTASSSKSNAGKGSSSKKNSTAAAANNGTQDHPAISYDDGEFVEDEDDNQLFCICLGKDDGRLMIMCEGCENWYHLECVELTPQQADEIASYYCHLCEQAGSGKTEWTAGAQASTADAPAPLPLPPPPLTPSDSGGEYDDRDYFDKKRRGGDSDDEDFEIGGGSSSTKRRKDSSHTQRKASALTASTTSQSKKKRRVVEDEEDAAEAAAQKEARAGSASAREDSFYGTSGKRSSNSPDKSSARVHCLKALVPILESILAEAGQSDEPGAESATTLDASQARPLAEQVEEALLAGYGEHEAGKSDKLPKQRYISRFRTLQFNLKSNAYFRSRVASGALTPEAIVAMSQEDLLTPEARAEQEAIKQQSLAQSVKAAAVQPKTRITHKGEEVLDEFDAAMTKTGAEGFRRPQEASQQFSPEPAGSPSESPFLEEEADSFATPMDPRDRDRSMLMSTSIPAASPRMDSHFSRFASPSAMSPGAAASPIGRAFSPVETDTTGIERRSSIAASPGLAAGGSDSREASLGQADTSQGGPRPDTLRHSRSDSLKAKLDLDSVWGAYSAPQPSEGSLGDANVEDEKPSKQKEEDDMDTDSDEENAEKDSQTANSKSKNADEDHDVEYDPFATTTRSTADDDFDAILGGESNPAEDGTAESTSKASTGISTEDDVEARINQLPPVWQGKIVNTPEESVPARLVQVGGPPMGILPQIWDEILPRNNLSINARIEVKAASEYLVQVRFASTRELVVLAIVPQGEPNSDGSFSEPSLDTRGVVSEMINVFSDRKRYGVCAPEGEYKKRVKDHYIVPLRKNDPLPDYIELLDEHMIPDTGKRTRDYLLSVLVLVKASPLHQRRPAPVNKSQSAPLPSSSSGVSVAHPNSHPQPLVHSNSSSAIPGLPVHPSTPIPVVPSHAGPPPHQALPGQANPVQPGIPALDATALQSLLNNPGLLQALQQGQMSPPSQSQPPMGSFAPAFSPPMPLGGGSAAPGMSPPQPFQAVQNPQVWGSGSPLQGQPGMQQGPAYGAAWSNPAGSPQWQGGAGAGAGSGGWPGAGAPLPPGAAMPPGYIHPDRIKQASLEARELAMRSGRSGSRDAGRREIDRDRDRNDDGSGRGRGDRSRTGDRGRDQRDRDWDRTAGAPPRGGEGQSDSRRGKRNSDYANGPRTSRDRGSASSSNQMRQGIQDRGWGNRK